MYDSLKDNVDHINNVRQKLSFVIVDLLQRAQEHDASKLEPPEKGSYDQFTEQLRTLKYGSEEYKEVLQKMKPAIQHHYENNHHHPEHYRDGLDGMNLMDIVEMVMDWKAAGERHKDKPTGFVESIEINAKRFNMSDQLKQIILNTAAYLEWI